MGEALYNRGIVNAMFAAEAIRTAMGKYGNKPLTAEQVRWGFENLNLTEQRLDQLGMKGFTHAGEGDLRGPRGQRPRADPAVGRQEVERGVRLGGADARRRPARSSRRRRSRKARSSDYTMRDCAKEK